MAELLHHSPSDADRESDRQRRFLEQLLTEQVAYENRKETMAHAVFLLQIGFATYVITSREWPPRWMLHPPYSGLLIPLLLASWLIIHIYVRWQLRDRRYAAIEIAAIIRTLAKWAHRCPSVGDMHPYDQEKKPKSLISSGLDYLIHLASLLDYLIPLAFLRVRGDLERNVLPKGFVDEWNTQEKKGTGAIRSEWILFFVSIGLLGLMLFRTSSGN